MKHRQPDTPTTDADRAAREVRVANLTAKADLVMEELSTVIEQMAKMLRDSARVEDQ